MRKVRCKVWGLRLPLVKIGSDTQLTGGALFGLET